VNSFGYGGTNAHVVLGGAPRSSDRPESEPVRRPCVLPLAARSDAALKELAARWRALPALRGDGAFAALPRAAAWRDTSLDHRLAIVASDARDLESGLRAYLEDAQEPNVLQGCASPERSRLVFVYTGMGPQWWGMARELAQNDQVFRDAL